MVEEQQKPISELKAFLPQHPRSYYEENNFLERSEEVDNGVLELRNATSCPACIMAALRQSNIPVPVASGFNFTEEMKEIWSEINESKVEPIEY